MPAPRGLINQWISVKGIKVALKIEIYLETLWRHQGLFTSGQALLYPLCLGWPGGEFGLPTSEPNKWRPRLA